MSSDDPMINRVFFDKFLCQKRIGKGSFGIVYSGINRISKDKIAIKMEKKDKNNIGTLEHEAKSLIALQGEGIPKIICYGNNLTHNILIQELLGRSLEDIFNSIGKKFSLKTVSVLGIEMVKLMQFTHSRHQIHRDIKPDNFMMGRDDNENKVYLIDFGLGKKYYSSTKNQHIRFCKGKSLTGTARYCARNAHRGYEQSRRDDIESIGYVLMYFLLGILPWQGLKLKQGEDQFVKIAEKKYATTFEELCQGQPNEFVAYFKHADRLGFEEEPDYNYLIGLFQDIINKYCSNCTYDFDWQKKSCTHLSIEQENKSRNHSLLVNNHNGGQSTLNQSQNIIDNSTHNDEEGNNDLFIKNDNECESFGAKDNNDDYAKNVNRTNTNTVIKFQNKTKNDPSQTGKNDNNQSSGSSRRKKLRKSKSTHRYSEIQNQIPSKNRTNKKEKSKKEHIDGRKVYFNDENEQGKRKRNSHISSGNEQGNNNNPHESDSKNKKTVVSLDMNGNWNINGTAMNNDNNQKEIHLDQQNNNAFVTMASDKETPTAADNKGDPKKRNKSQEKPNVSNKDKTTCACIIF